jgi:hypothetical protein
MDPNIPPPSSGVIQPSRLNPGKIIYSKELTFKGGSHGSTLSIIPEEKKELINTRVTVLAKQEERTRERLKELQDRVQQRLKASGASSD